MWQQKEDQHLKFMGIMRGKRPEVLGEEFLEVRHPFKKGFPPIKEYFKEYFERASFIHTYALTEVRRQNLNSLFGQLWLLLNPLALAGIYYILLYIINKNAASLTFAHLVSTILLFYFISNSLTDGVKSITTANSLLLNSRFPRLILPSSSTLVGVYKFLPTIVIIIAVKIISGSSFALANLYALLSLVSLVILTFALTIIVSISNVYFRDTQNILPFALRTLLYLSPILFKGSALPEKITALRFINPFYPVFDAFSQSFLENSTPDLKALAYSLALSLILLIIAISIFLRRERELVVRL